MRENGSTLSKNAERRSADPPALGIHRRQFLALLPAAAIPIAGCDGRAPAFRNTDVTGADFGKSFELTNHTGQVRRLEDFRGKILTVFFGFTQCPDVCPSTLAEMAEVKIGRASCRERV